MTNLDLPMSADRELLLGSLQRFLTDHPRANWRELADGLGLAGVAVPETAGGFGGGAIDIALVAAELGPSLAGADWLSHAAATMLLALVDPGHGALPDLAAGQRRAAIVCPTSAASMPVVEGDLVRGTAALVAGSAEADLLVVAGDAIFVLPASPGAVEQRHRIMHDGTVTADLNFSARIAPGGVLTQGKTARALSEWIADLILAARCAEAVGLMRRMVADSVDYLGQRRQFGAPIGSFQALRHRLADMQIAMMKAAALTEMAVLAVDEDRPDRARLVSAACVEIADAARIVGEGAVQIHGAMGLTEELRLGGYFKRALAIAAGLGPRAGHLARFAEA